MELIVAKNAQFLKFMFHRHSNFIESNIKIFVDLSFELRITFNCMSVLSWFSTYFLIKFSFFTNDV